MIEIAWFIPVVYCSLLVGVLIALSSWIAYDKRREKRIKGMVYDSESWCQQHCRYLSECWENNKDPDDAWKALDEHCIECPMAKAIDVWEQHQLKQKG